MFKLLRLKMQFSVTLMLIVVGLGGPLVLIQQSLMNPAASLAYSSLAPSPPSFEYDFSMIEHYLQDIVTASGHEVKITPQLDSPLRLIAELIAAMPQAGDNSNRSSKPGFPKGLSNLITHSFAGNNGRLLAALTECFYHYEQTESEWLNAVLEPLDVEGAPVMADLSELQARYFGEPLASALFADYRGLYRLLQGTVSFQSPPVEALPAGHQAACAQVGAAAFH